MDDLAAVVWPIDHIPPYEDAPANFAIFIGATGRNKWIPVGVGNCFSSDLAKPADAVAAERDNDEITWLDLLNAVSGAVPAAVV